MSIGIWLVRPECEALAAALASRVGAALYRPWLNASRTQKDEFATAYRREGQWVMIAASGIAVRFLEGIVEDKHTDPAVVLLDEAGRYAVSFLGGHEGGANRLAYLVANAVGAVPVITTATEAVKPLVVGIGCRRDVSSGRVEAAVHLALGARKIDEVREVVTIDLKAKEPGLIEFCEAKGLPLRVLARETVAARPWVTRPSAWVQKNVGLDGVCEPCALIASLRGKLITPKTALDGVAVAVAEDNYWMGT